MNYERHYALLIEKATNKGTDRKALKKSKVYFERHHIIPRCMGGSDRSENLVLLTPEEHYVAHQLLYKMYNEPKLLYALRRMSGNSSCNTGRNKAYGWIKRQHSKLVSAKNKERFSDPEERRKLSRKLKGRQLTPEHRAAISESNRTRTVTAETKRKISDSLTGRTCSDELRQKRSKNQKGRKYSPEFGKAISERQTGKCQSKLVTCPHCSKEGRLSGMIRWHFDKCKNTGGQ